MDSNNDRQSKRKKAGSFQVKEQKNEKSLFENLISKKALAQQLSLSIAMIDRLMSQGLPHYKIGRAVRFNYTEVMEHLKRRKFP